ncbi:MAG: hypothetical protein HRK26_04590 [Rickettsiaceae bacterium H1]|nr:hypothetical protein [Rickettsiaceae bacterium H1]
MNTDYLSLTKAATIHILTCGSAVILYAIHYSKPLDFRIFISTLVVAQMLGTALLVNEVHNETKKIKKWKQKLDEINNNSFDTKIDASKKSKNNKLFFYLATAVTVSQLISAVGDTALSILYFNTNKVSTKQYVSGILICLAIGTFIPIIFEYTAIEKEKASSNLIEVLEEKVETLEQTKK